MPKIWHTWFATAACTLLLRASIPHAAPAVSIDASLDASRGVVLRVVAPPATGLAVVPLGTAWAGCEGWPRVIEPEALSTGAVAILLPMDRASHWLVLVHDATGATARALLDATALTAEAPSLRLSADTERPHSAIGVVRTTRGTPVAAQRVLALPADALPYADRAGQLACPACTAWLGASFGAVVATSAVATATSGADGKFALEIPPGTWVVGACDPGGACSYALSVTIKSDDAEPTPLDLVASRQQGVAVIVEDDLGMPMAGAHVEVFPKADPSQSLAAGTTDSSGRWLGTALPMRELIVRARAPHHAPDEIIAAGEMPLRVTLLRCGRASGRVVDRAGPRAGVRVEGLHVIPASERMTPPRVEPTESFTTTDETGSWHLDDIPSGRILLRASSPLDLPAVSDPVDVRAGESFVVPDLVLRPGSFVSGAVVDSVSQDGIVRATVSVVGQDAPSCATDGEGNFRLGPLEEGAMRIVARDAAHPPTPDDERDVTVAPPGDDDVAVKLTLQPAATLEVRLVTSAGEAVPGVRLQVTAGPAKRQPPTRTDETDADGTVSFDDLPAGPACVGDLANEAEEWVTLVAGRVTRMTLVQLGTRIHGRILRDGQPAEAVVSMHDVGVLMGRARAFMLPATTYAVTGAMPPTARLTIAIPFPPVVDRETHWYIEEDSVPIAEGELDIEHDIVLHAAPVESEEEAGGIWLTGRVVDAATNEPVATIRVIGGGHTAGITDARGRFATGVVGDGDYTLEARADSLRQAEMAGLLESESVAVHVESGCVVSPPSIVIHVKRGPAARLRVLGASGPAAGACAWRIDRPLVLGGGSTGWSDASGLVTLYANEGGAQPVAIIAPDGTVGVFDVNFGSANEQILQLPRTGSLRVTLPPDAVASVKQSTWPRAITMYEIDFGCRGCAWRDVGWGDGFRRIEFRALPIGQVELSAGSTSRTVLVREDAPAEVDLR